MERIARIVATAAAPILPFTAEEIWQAIPGTKEESVHLACFETASAAPSPAAPAWERLVALREEVAGVLEEARREKTIGSSLEAAVELAPTPELEKDRQATGNEGPALADLFIVSEVIPAAGPTEEWTESRAYPGARLRFVKAAGRRCDRCWKVTREADATGLCDRCRRVLEEISAETPA